MIPTFSSYNSSDSHVLTFFFLTYFFYYTRLYTPDFCFYFYSDPICHIQFVVREHRLSNSILRKPGAHTLFAANSLCYLPYYLHFYIYLRFQFCFLLPFCMLHDTHWQLYSSLHPFIHSKGYYILDYWPMGFFFCIIRAVTVLHRKIHCFLSMGVVLVKEVRLRGLFTIRYIALI